MYQANNKQKKVALSIPVRAALKKGILQEINQLLFDDKRDNSTERKQLLRCIYPITWLQNIESKNWWANERIDKYRKNSCRF